MRQLVLIAASMARKYDVVVTNPPYMGSNNSNNAFNNYVKAFYPENKSDIFAVFIEKCINLAKITGYISMITMQSWMFLSSFEKLRSLILNKTITSLVQIGYNSFPEINSKVVQSVSFVINSMYINQYKGRYFDLSRNYPQAFDKHQAFFIEKDNGGVLAKQDLFSNIPGRQIAYWIRDNIIHNFRVGESITKYVDTFQGIITGNNDFFLRLWFEVDINRMAIGIQNMSEIDLSKEYWIPYNKGGEFRKWYGNQDYVVNWKNGPDDKVRGKKSFEQYYLREYVSWSYITSSTLACRYFPKRFLWDVSGSGIFDKSDMLFNLQALIGSKVGSLLLNIINPTLNYQVENIAQLPVIIKREYKIQIDELVKNNISIAKRDWDRFEISWNFAKHPFIEYRSFMRRISEVFDEWSGINVKERIQLKSNEEELNRIFIDIYGLQDELTPEVDDKDITIRKADLGRDVRSFLSYAVGCMFGRYSLDVDGLAYAGGEWDSSKYKTFIPDKDNVIPITDEEYFEDDIVGLFCAFLKKTFGEETLEENLDFIATALGNKGNTSREVIRNYFLKDFFKDHRKIYQKRPIYWLFDSGKADGFKALVYMHRYNADTIGNLRIDYLHRMQRVYDSEIARMQETIDNSGNAREVAAATKRKEKLTKQLKETKEYDEKIAHLALARIEIDLDDGVKVNYDKVQTAGDGKKYEILAKI